MYRLQGLMFLFAPYTCQIYSFKILEPYLPLGPCNECVFIHDHGWFTFSVYIISVGYAFVLDPPKKEKREPWPPKISASLLLQAAIHRSEGPVPSTEGDKKRGGLLMGFWWILWWHQRILAYQCSKKHAYHAKTDVEFVVPFRGRNAFVKSNTNIQNNDTSLSHNGGCVFCSCHITIIWFSFIFSIVSHSFPCTFEHDAQNNQSSKVSGCQKKRQNNHQNMMHVNKTKLCTRRSKCSSCHSFSKNVGRWAIHIIQPHG